MHRRWLALLGPDMALDLFSAPSTPLHLASADLLACQRTRNQLQLSLPPIHRIAIYGRLSKPRSGRYRVTHKDTQGSGVLISSNELLRRALHQRQKMYRLPGLFQCRPGEEAELQKRVDAAMSLSIGSRGHVLDAMCLNCRRRV